MVARDFRGEKTLATAYRLGNDWDPKWFTKWLDNKGCKDYLLNDTHTEEGRMNVAKFNNYKADCDEKVATLTSSTSVQEKIHSLLMLHTINGSAHHIYDSSIKGLHRTLAILHALLVSKIDPYTARFSLNSLTLDDLISAGLTVCTPKPTETSFQENIKDCLDSKKPNVMMDTPILMQALFISNNKCNSKKVMEAARYISEKHLDNKRYLHLGRHCVTLGSLVRTLSRR